ncbi:E3 ubiquitin protein ligase DRIP2-like isoform X2 [Euphorbia lathyris]|uniref:E3 ubiquitin protein ligase DRIP2-like isoform X2 n=1 Tax=Euphorbia lathyris TaxID=212925 RepID=UPI0033130F19
MLRQVVKVRREKLAPCITCPLCNKFFRDATTISECLHSFCRKCIYQKINDEEYDTCPVCNINLGCLPLEKLRADNSLEDLKTKIFSSQREKVKSVVVVQALPAVSLPVKRKELSLSSLVANAATPPKVLAPAPQLVPRPSKRLKAIARKGPALRGIISIDENHVKKIDDLHERLSSPETIEQAKRQHKTNKDSKDSAEPCEERADLWIPLSGLVDVAGTSKHKKSNNLQEIPVVQTMQLPDPAEREAQVLKHTVEEQINKPKVNGDENNSVPCSSGSVKTRKLRQKRVAVSERLNFTAQAIVDSNSQYDGRFNPIWLLLIAADDQEGEAPLPQLSSCYMRFNDLSLPVSFIKKHLAKKLGLTDEDEVEIWLLSQPVDSTVQLHELVDVWKDAWQLFPTTSEIIHTRVGSSANDFVVVLSYSRKSLSP